MTIRVLLADDQALLRATFRLLVDATDDMEVVAEAADGQDAVTKAREAQADVVVMDIRMPGRDGVSVLREVGKPPPRVILMTAYAKERHLKEAREKAFAVVHKPFPVPQLLDLVASAVGAPT